MYGNVEDIFNLLLSDPTAGLDAQKRILEYGIENNYHELLAKLAVHPNLEKSIDDKLAELDAVVVRAAWIGREGRKPDEILMVLGKEKRVNVLLTILSNESIPESIFEKVLSSTKSKKLAQSILDKSNFSEELRLLAARRLFEIETSKVNISEQGSVNGFDYSLSRFCENLLTKSPKVEDFIRKSEILEALVSISSSAEVTLEEFEKSLALFKSRLENLDKLANGEKKEMVSGRYYHNTIGNAKAMLVRAYSSYVEGIVDNSSFNSAIEEKFQESYNLFANFSDSTYAKDELKECKKLFKVWKKTPSAKFLDEIEAATTSGEIEDIVSRVSKLLQNNSERLSNAGRVKIANNIFSNPLTSLGSIKIAASWLSWHDGLQDSFRKVGLEDTDRALAFMLGSDYYDVDNFLDLVNDPKTLLSRLITAFAKKANLSNYCEVENLLQSKHMTYDLARNVPLNEIIRADIETLNAGVISEIRETIADDKHWSNFKTLASEFNGSFAQLLELSKTL